MKVILYMATTLNGKIAKLNNETPWSEEEWISYSNVVHEVKNIVIGWNTYELMKEENEFEKIGNPFVVVLTSKNIEPNLNFAFVDSPQKALGLLKEKGFDKTLIAGGSEVNASFLQNNLIDEIYVDIEPFVFGNGVPLFAENDFNVNLEFLGIKQLSKDTIQLHYLVKKL